MSNADPTSPDRWATSLTWVARIVPAVALVVVGWCLVAAFPAIAHAHPAYPVLLALTVVAAAFVGWRAWRSRWTNVSWRRILRIIALALSIVWIAVLGWLCPLSAREPALAAMASNAAVTVVESPTQIVLTPTATPSSLGVFFQPGAKVDARAYAAVLRPLAEAGHVVVITKQPLGIAFLAQDAFVNARRTFPLITGWVVGGHSLGGTVAAEIADDHDQDEWAPVVGLLLYASYPARPMPRTLYARVLSISASNDGLATPAKIDAAKGRFSEFADYRVIQGGVHAFFGDYGPQSGDGVPTISHDDARDQTVAATKAFLASLTR